MIDIFGVSWAALDLSDVARFFDQAGDEAILWEAKSEHGDERLRPDSIRKEVAGFANQIGGYLVLGVWREKESGEWRIEGANLDHLEPALWISQILNDLYPAPKHAVKYWSLDNSKRLVVVKVDPIGESPCVGPSGRIYQRIDSESVPIEDPTILATLLARGREARARAENNAVRAAERVIEIPKWRGNRALALGVGLASRNRETDDISSVLFTKATRRVMHASVAKLPLTEVGETSTEQHQDSFAVTMGHGPNQIFATTGRPEYVNQRSWTEQACWDGSVGIGGWFSDGTLLDGPPPSELLSQAWKEADKLLQILGGYGPATLTVLLHVTKKTEIQVRAATAFSPGVLSPRVTVYSKLPEVTVMSRSVYVGGVEVKMVESLHRELERAAGLIRDEPAD